MRFVLDSSVGFKTLVAETDSVKAQQLYDNYRKGIHELLAPDVFPVEVAHSITRAERQARITPAQGARLLTDILNRLPQMYPSLPLFPRAYAISSSARRDHLTIGKADPLISVLIEELIADSPVGLLVLAPVGVNLSGDLRQQLVGNVFHGKSSSPQANGLIIIKPS